MAKQREHKKYTKPEVKYEDIAGRMYENLENLEAFYFAALMKSEEHGKEGQRDGLYASLWGLKNKVGLEGVLSVLEAQGEASIESGNGLNSQFSLESVIGNSAKNFLESYMNLKPKDIIKYIKDRVDVEIEEKYSNEQIKDLIKKDADKEKKAYAEYLLSQTRNSVMAKMMPLVYAERADRENKRYLAEQIKEKSVPIEYLRKRKEYKQARQAA